MGLRPPRRPGAPPPAVLAIGHPAVPLRPDLQHLRREPPLDARRRVRGTRSASRSPLSSSARPSTGCAQVVCRCGRRRTAGRLSLCPRPLPRRFAASARWSSSSWRGPQWRRLWWTGVGGRDRIAVGVLVDRPFRGRAGIQQQHGLAECHDVRGLARTHCRPVGTGIRSRGVGVRDRKARQGGRALVHPWSDFGDRGPVRAAVAALQRTPLTFLVAVRLPDGRLRIRRVGCAGHRCVEGTASAKLGSCGTGVLPVGRAGMDTAVQPDAPEAAPSRRSRSAVPLGLLVRSHCLCWRPSGRW